MIGSSSEKDIANAKSQVKNQIKSVKEKTNQELQIQIGYITDEVDNRLKAVKNDIAKDIQHIEFLLKSIEENNKRVSQIITNFNI